jgi:molybdopterin-guanine dinucleotide biosynthesis protein A
VRTVNSRAAIVLAGGRASRLGGRLKPTIEVGGVRMLDRVIAALAGHAPVVVAGPEELAVPPDVVRVREDPPGGGPVAAIGAAFALLDGIARTTGPVNEAAGPTADAAGPKPETAGVRSLDVDPVGRTVTIVAGDLPLLTTGAIDRLHRALGGETAHDAAAHDAAAHDAAAHETVAHDAAAHETVAHAALAHDAVAATDRKAVARADHVAAAGREAEAVAAADGALYVDESGRWQWLCGVWRPAAISRRLAELAGERGSLTGCSLKALLGSLTFHEIGSGGESPSPFTDCDTEDDIRRVEEWLSR